jgi:iron(III) transport system substrate-binding protein
LWPPRGGTTKSPRALAPALAQEKVLNLYSARHYQTDEALYDNFSKATGIRINRVEADDAGILARLKAEGTASPADVILLVDAARLWRGEQDGLFQPVKSALLEQRIPAQFRGGETAQGAQWFGMSTRARMVVYDKLRLKPSDVDSYEKLADPALKGQFCVRSGSHPYNLSLFGSMLEHLGPQKPLKPGSGPGVQHGAPAQGWRHRPDQGRGVW